MPQPAILLIVTGAPASGKSTTARRLAAELGWPLLAKDALKDALLETLGAGNRAWSRRLSDASFALAFMLVREWAPSSGSLVLEANFRPEHAPQLRELAANVRARLAQVLCTASSDLITQRLRARAADASRHPGHLDAELAQEVPRDLAELSQPLELPGPRWQIDTSIRGEAALDTLVARVRREFITGRGRDTPR